MSRSPLVALPFLVVLFVLTACGGRTVDAASSTDAGSAGSGSGGGSGSSSGDPGTAWIGTYVCTAAFVVTPPDEGSLVVDSFVMTLSGNEIDGKLEASNPVGTLNGAWAQTLTCHRT